MAEATVAAVDIGTNSVRLLVGTRDADGGLRTLVRQQWLTRLGQGVDRTGELADDAIGRTVDAVRQAAALWAGFDVGRVRITATSAARDAANADRFSAAVEDVAGVAPEVISGEAEAALAFLGASTGLQGFEISPTLVVLDIGGGSTEVIIGDPATGDVHDAFSMQLGSVRLTERHLKDDPPTRLQVQTGQRVVRERMAVDLRGVLPLRSSTLAAVAGTATTVGAVALALDGYDAEHLHGLVLPREQVVEVAMSLLATPAAAIADNPAVEVGREDVIAGGALILAVAMEVLHAPAVTISTTDLLDGLAIDLLDAR